MIDAVRLLEIVVAIVFGIFITLGIAAFFHDIVNRDE